MSRTIDERVVSMQFDNKHFENNVQTTLSTLDKLKRALKLDGASKGLQDVGAAAKKCDLSPIGDSAQKVVLKFNALYTMADQAFRNMYNSAEHYAKRIVSAFTIDPVKTGFQEYETQINAVQTILANTQSKGTTLDDVNAALDELNAYADETIYNFTEMTRNIGTFTAAGIDLDTATNAIQGIANLAAVSGSTSQQASTAMYQLSQALASGTVKLMDWNSVVNAGMGGQVFQDALKETARVHGIAIDDMIKEQGSFRETLHEGWLTSEILTETLMKFTLTTEGLTDEQIKANREMLKAKGYTDEQINSIFSLGQTATDAATKVKTFTQLFDTLKEAAQSGWTQSWEIIIGDFEEAKEMWTKVSETIGEIIGKRAEKRNTLLEGALGSNWDRMEQKIVAAGGSIETFEEQLRKSMTEAGLNVDELLEDFGSFEKVFKEGKTDVKYLEDALVHMNETVEGIDLSKITAGLKDYSRGEDVKQLQTALVELGYELPKWGIDGIFHTETKKAVSEFQKAQGLTVTGIVDEATLAALKEATSETKSLNLNVKDIIDGVTELGGRERLLNSFKNIFEAMRKPIAAIAAAWGNVMGQMSPETLYNAIHGFEKFTHNLIITDESADQLARGFKGLFAIVKTLGTVVGGVFRIAFLLVNKVLENFDMNLLEAFGYLGDLLLKFEDWISKNNYIAKGIEWVADKIAVAITAIKEWFKTFWQLPKVQKFVNNFKATWKNLNENIGEYAMEAVNAVKEFFVTIYESPKVQGLLTKLKDRFIDTFDKVKERLSGLIDAFKAFFKRLRSGEGFSIKEAFSAFKDTVVDYFANLDFKAIAKNVLSKIGNFIKNLVVNIVDIGKAVFGAIGTFLTNTWDAFEGIGKFIKENIGAIVALASIALLLSTLRKIKMAVELISGPLDAIQEALEGLTVAAKRAATASLIKSLGISIGIIAASIAVLAQLDRDDLIAAVSAIGAIAAILGVLTFAMAKTVKHLNTKDTAALSAFLLSIGGAMILMAATAKIMGSMTGSEWLKGVGAIAVFIGVMTLMVHATKGIEGDISKFGSMMFKMSASLIILAIAMKMFSKMDGDVILKGGGVIIGFLTVMTFMMKSTSKVGTEADKFGKMMLSISAGLILMAFAVKMLGKMDKDELIQGGIAIGALMLIVGLMTKMTKIGAGEKSGAYSFGKMMSGIGTALLLMSGAILILGKMDIKDLIQGGIAVGVLMGIMAVVAKATKGLGKNSKDLGKVGTMMMGFGAALLLISGSIILLGLIDEDKMKRGLLAVAVIGAVFAALVHVSKGIKGLKLGPIIGVAAAVAVLAGAVIALSFIDKDKLITASACMSVLMLSLSAVMKQMSGMKKLSAKSLIGVLAVAALVGGIAYLMKLLTEEIKDPDAALKVTIGLSALMLAIAVTLNVVGKVANAASGVSSSGIKTAIGLLSVVAIAVVGLGALAIWQMPNIAKQFSAFMNELDDFITGAENIDETTLRAIKTLAEVMSIMGGASIKFGVAKLFGVDSLTPFKEFIKEAVPVVQEMAVEISDDNVKIDAEKVGAIVGAVKALAEAASNVPSFMAGGGLGFGAAAGGVIIPQLEKFTEFIKEAVPLVKDMAIDVSAKTINVNSVNAVVGAVSALSQAAANAPGIDVDAGGGGAKGKMIAYASVDVPLMGKFKEFIVAASTELGNFAVKMDGIEVEPETVQGICDIVGALGTAASGMPVVKAGGGFGKVGMMIGIMGGAEVPLLGQFKTFISSSLAAIGEFSNALSAKSGTSYDITEEKIEIIKDVCDIVTMLGSAATKVPSAEVFTDIKAAGGRLAGKFFGVSTSGGAKWPAFDSTVKFFKSACNAVKDLALDPELPDIDENKITTLSGVCDCVALLAGAAEHVPEQSEFQLISAAATKLGGGFVYADGGTWPDFDNTIKFFEAVIPLMTDFVAPVGSADLEEGDLENLKSICEAVGVLAKSTTDISKDGTVDLGGAFVTTGALGIGGAHSKWSTNFEGTVKFFECVTPLMTGFTADISASTIEAEDLTNLTSIANGVLTLAQAAGSLPQEGNATALLVFGGVGFIGAATAHAEWETNFGEAVDFFAKVTPIMTNWAVDIKASGITADDTDNLLSIAGGVKALAEAAGEVPPESKASALLGFVSYECSTNLKEFGEFIATASEGMTGWVTSVKTNEITDEDLKNIDSLCKAIDSLAESSDDIPKKTEFKMAGGVVADYVSAADFDTFREWLEGDGGDNGGICGSINKIKESLVDMSWDSSLAGRIQSFGLAVEALTVAASYVPTTEEAEGLWYKRITTTDFSGFTEWLIGLGQAVKKFNGEVGSIDVDVVSEAAIAVRNIGEGIGHLYTEFGDYVISSTGLSDKIERFKTMLNGITEALDAFDEYIDDLEIDLTVVDTAASAFSTVMNAMTKLAEINYDNVNIPAFNSVVEDATAAVNKFATSIESPDQITATVGSIDKIVDLFTGMDEGMYDSAVYLKDALELFSDGVLVADFISAFTSENLGTARTNFNDLADDIASLITKGISDDTASAFATSLETLGGTGVDEFISAFTTANDDNAVTTAVEGLVNAAKSAAGSQTMIDKFIGVGESLAGGLATGISNKSSSVTKAAKQVASDAYAAAMEELEINSPSKKFMRLGYGIDEGFVKGIDGMSYLVTRSAVNVADSAIEGTKSVISRLASAIDSDIDTQPTIRPVLDLSNVSSGASTINGMFGMRPSIRTLSNVGYLSASVTNRQNGSNSDVISAIEKLGSKLGKTGDTYQFGDISYDNDSALNNAVGQLVRAARIERRK